MLEAAIGEVARVEIAMVEVAMVEVAMVDDPAPLSNKCLGKKKNGQPLPKHG